MQKKATRIPIWRNHPISGDSTIKKGESILLRIDIDYGKWSSENQGIATVDSNGLGNRCKDGTALLRTRQQIKSYL